MRADKSQVATDCEHSLKNPRAINHTHTQAHTEREKESEGEFEIERRLMRVRMKTKLRIGEKRRAIIMEIKA